jgi:hypothetical protein
MSSFVSNLSKFKIKEPFSSPEKLPSSPTDLKKILKDVSFLPGVPDSLEPLLKREFKVTTTFKGGETQG